MSIEKFYAALNSETEESSLMAILRQLTQLKSAKEVRQPRPMGGWSMWWYG